jgi:beta-lysine 5,6-aminomutase alpha subunit
VTTKQTIHLCGMPTEAIHTPFLGDRALALDNARYIMNTARHLGEEIEFRPDGIVERRAAEVLRGARAVLEKVAERGLMESIAAGDFADVKRSPDGGRGFDGVFERAGAYWNPFEEALLPASAASSAR